MGEKLPRQIDDDKPIITVSRDSAMGKLLVGRCLPLHCATRYFGKRLAEEMFPELPLQPTFLDTHVRRHPKE